ncbi:TlpA family protein disulfide reductase [Paenibacillus yanchengensis]|uniref:TlpA family protein disulfide reductase n=1 Tax=Paenibacillus yanchengensis TaxID=2035833 RepID=A0ABW4YNR9_9BACL
MRKVMMLFIAAFVLAGFSVVEYNRAADENGSILKVNAGFSPTVGHEMVPFQLPDMEEESVWIKSGEKKLIFLNFWASWCGPCELEAPDLQKLHEKYGDVMTIYGINSTKNDKERAARQFVEDYKFTFPVVFDREGDITKLFKIQSYPTNFLVDSNGVIRERIPGVITYEDWERRIEKWLEK